MPIITNEEKLFLEKISAISRIDKATVIQVLQSLLMITNIEVFSNKNEIIIPYICKLKVDYQDRITSKGIITDVNLQAQPNRALINEISCIAEGEETPTKKYFKANLKKHLLKQYDLEE